MTGHSPGVVAEAITQMLSIEKCKQLLTQNGAKYTDEEVKQIRDLFYQLGKIDHDVSKQKKLKDEKRNHLHKGVNGRSS